MSDKVCRSCVGGWDKKKGKPEQITHDIWTICVISNLLRFLGHLLKYSAKHCMMTWVLFIAVLSPVERKESSVWTPPPLSPHCHGRLRELWPGTCTDPPRPLSDASALLAVSMTTQNDPISGGVILWSLNWVLSWSALSFSEDTGHQNTVYNKRSTCHKNTVYNRKSTCHKNTVYNRKSTCHKNTVYNRKSTCHKWM